MKLEKDLIPVEKKNGKLDNTLDTNMNLEKGLYVGLGFDLHAKDAELQKVYVPRKDLNAHMLVTGTTRQGKSRFMAAAIKQQMQWGDGGDNIIVYDPKGSEGQEIIAWVLEAAAECGRTKDVKYLSLFFKEESEKFNPLYGLKNEQISSLIESIIDSEEFYKNIGESIVMSACLGLEFLEKFQHMSNPFYIEIMKKIEHLNVLKRHSDYRNMYIWGDEYVEEIHGEKLDIFTAMKSELTASEKKDFDEALDGILLRYQSEGESFKDILPKAFPLRTYITLRDLSRFDNVETLKALSDLVKEKYREFKNSIWSNNRKMHSLAQEAIMELERVSTKDTGFFSKVSTTYSTVMSKLITGDVGEILCSCKINPLIDSFTSKDRGCILIVQPFPMIYKSAATALGKMLFSMMTFAAGYIGASGKMLKRRINLNIDEAGSVLIPIVKELSNKGGGLGVSLYLYTQSFADVEETLEETGARILFDNLNTKMAFKGNDNRSMEEISLILGDKKDVKLNVTASDGRDMRQMNSVQEAKVASASILQRMKAQQFVIKIGSHIYVVTSVFQPDPILKIAMPLKPLEELTDMNDQEYQSIREMIV